MPVVPLSQLYGGKICAALDRQHQFPSVKWKLMNLAKFKKESPEVYQLQLEKLSALLAS